MRKRATEKKRKSPILGAEMLWWRYWIRTAYIIKTTINYEYE